MSARTPAPVLEEISSVEPPVLSSDRRRRGRVTLGIVVVVLVVAGVIVAINDPFGGNGSATAGSSVHTSLATVTRRDLSSQTNVNGTLGYADTYSVVGQAQGTITALPTVGQVVNRGQSLYSVNTNPIVLLYGSVPAYRTLAAGMSGADVVELNANLVALGFATASQINPTSDDFTAATTTALKKLQGALGVTKTGSLALGDAVVLPGAARVTAVTATMGGAAGGPILTASSTTRVIAVALNALQQSQVKVGDQVTITLPDSKTTAGVVSIVGTVATAQSQDSAPTIEVTIVPTDPAATGNLDHAPVSVSIVTATVKDALVVPVAALLALAGGGYAVETVTARHVHSLEPVTLGLFDDAQGVVQVTGAGLAAGERVVVPSL